MVTDTSSYRKIPLLPGGADKKFRIHSMTTLVQNIYRTKIYLKNIFKKCIKKRLYVWLSSNVLKVYMTDFFYLPERI